MGLDEVTHYATKIHQICMMSLVDKDCYFMQERPTARWLACDTYSGLVYRYRWFRVFHAISFENGCYVCYF